jgi:glycosyltransferase involved in cell wall biosynthesis
VNSTPVVSVVMPAYNAAGFIREGIASVLAQTFADFELIVVDDASKDDTAVVVESIGDPRIVLLRLAANSGAVGARNAGIAAARGRYIALLDADDLAQPNRFERQVELLERSGADVCASNHETWNPGTGRRRRGRQYERDADLKALMTVFCPIVNSSVTGKVEAFRAAPYDAGFALAEDYELWARMSAQGRVFVAIEDPLVTYRLHDDQISVRNAGRVQEASDGVRARYLRDLGLADELLPRRLPWRERLVLGPRFLRLLGGRVGTVSVKANYEIYARFQFRGNGAWTPFVRLERWLVALWAHWSPLRATR